MRPESHSCLPPAVSELAATEALLEIQATQAKHLLQLGRVANALGSLVPTAKLERTVVNAERQLAEIKQRSKDLLRQACAGCPNCTCPARMQ